MSEEQVSLFASFPSVSASEWKAQIVKDLKGADYHKELLSPSGEGFDIEPFYTKSPVPGSLANLDNFSYDPAAYAPRVWWNQVKIQVEDSKQANAEALHALANGAEAVCFVIHNAAKAAIPTLIKGIDFPYCGMSFECSEGCQQIQKDLQAALTASDHPIDQWTGYLHGVDLDYASSATLMIASPKARWFSFATPVHLPVHQKVGSLLAAWITKADQLPASAWQHRTIFHYALSDQYLLEIAGLRACRWLFQQIAAQIGKANATLQIAASTTVKPEAELEGSAHTNMISNTTQAMSGVLGGCNYLTVQPHDHHEGETSFSRRIARNVSSILKEESYLDKNADPVAGTYAINALTEAIARQSWQWVQAQL